MSNYTKTTNFATKDSLASGNPNKIVKGTEINSEFDNIATAVATKANTASPSLTGTVTAAALNVTGNLDVDGTLEFDSISGTGSVAVTDIADEDNMSSNSATKLATQQSIKAYVDSQVTAQDLDLTDGSTSISIDLDSEALSVLGGTGVTSTASGNGVTLAIDSTVTTLTGSQTLTNKTLTSPDVNTPDIDGGTIDGTVIGGATAAAGSFTTVGATGNITVGGTVDGRDVATDGTKLDGIEASATADQSNAEIRTAVEAATDSNVFTDADHTKLNAIEASATADQTDAEIRTAVEAASDSNVFTDADHTKLNAIEASADVTDTANVTAAGALMDSELTAIASVKALNQGVATGDSPTFVDVTATSLDISGDIDVDGTTNLDVVDIDGAVDMASTLAVAGDANFDSGTLFVDVSVNSVGIGNGTTEPTATLDVRRPDASGKIAEFHQSAGFGLELGSSQAQAYIQAGSNQTLLMTVPSDITIDAGGDINLDADGGDVRLKDNGTEFGRISNSASSLQIYAPVQDKDINLLGNDGGTTITALTLDMSEAGTAYFNSGIHIPDFIYHSGDTHTYFGFQGGDQFELETGGANRMSVVGSETVFNDDGGDKNFRVESSGNANMLFVDGGNDQVLIGTSSGLNPSDAGLYARNGLIVGNFSGSGNGFTVYRGSGLNTNISHDSTKAFLTTSGIPLHFRTTEDANYKISMETGGVVINEGGVDLDFRVESNGNANMLFVDGGNNHIGMGTATLNRSGLGADHICLTVGADTQMGMLELQGTRTSNADLGRVSFLNAGTRRAEIVAARIDADNSTKLYFQTSNAGTLGTRLTIGKDGAATFTSSVSAKNVIANNAAEGNTYFTGGTASSRLLNVFTSTFSSAANAGHNFKIASGQGAFIFGNNTTANLLTIKSGGVDVVGALTAEEATFTNADNSANLTLVSTDTDANAGPLLVLDRQSANPADGDVLGQIQFNGKNDAAEAHGYAKIEARIVDASNATEDGRLELMTSVATEEGISRILMNATETVINDNSKDLDFRVESDNNSHALFVEGSGTGIAVNSNGTDATGFDSTLKLGGSVNGGGLVAYVQEDNVANGSYVDVNVGSSNINYWTGMLGVNNSSMANGDTRTQSLTSILANNQTPTFSTSVLHTADGGTAASFTVTYVDNGTIRITNTSGVSTGISAWFTGGGTQF